VKLEHEQRKFGSNTDDMGKKIDAKIAIKELKAGLKEMKRENGLGGSKIGKDEKKAVKKELKGLKNDLKAQMKEVRRERRGLKREERDRRREFERSIRDGRRRCERRGTRWEGIEEQDWNRDSIPRPDIEGQVTGITATHDATYPEPGKDVQT
jgi:hypothetical protein